MSKEGKEEKKEIFVKRSVGSNKVILSSFETFGGIVRYSLVWKMTTTMMNRTTTTMLMIMGLFINDVIIFLKMKTVLKICEVTKK